RVASRLIQDAETNKPYQPDGNLQATATSMVLDEQHSAVELVPVRAGWGLGMGISVLRGGGLSTGAISAVAGGAGKWVGRFGEVGGRGLERLTIRSLALAVLFSPGLARAQNIDLGGVDQTIGSLAGAGIVTNSGTATATLTAGGDNTSTIFS